MEPLNPTILPVPPAQYVPPPVTEKVDIGTAFIIMLTVPAIVAVQPVATVVAFTE